MPIDIESSLSITLSQQAKLIIQHALQHVFRPAIVARGKALFVEKKVQNIFQEKQSSLLVFYGEVLGSWDTLYEAELVVDVDREMVFWACSCPYGFNCKHSVAMAYALLEFRGERAANNLKPEDWLSQFRASLIPHQSQPSPKSWALCYLIHQTNNLFTLALSQRYQKMSGDWGRLESVSPMQLEYNHDLSNADREVLNLVSGADSSVVRRGNVNLDYCYQAKGARGRQLLEWALKSGRAFDMETLAPLYWGMPRSLNFEWQAVNKGERLVPFLEPAPEGDWILCEQLVPPLYCCGTTIGPVDTTIESHQLGLILRMPAVSSLQKIDISMQMQHQFSEDVVAVDEPLPETVELAEAVPGIRMLGVETPASGVLPALRFSVNYGELNFLPEFDSALQRAKSPVVPELVATDSGYARLSRDWAQESVWVQRLRGLPMVPYNYGPEEGELWVPAEVNPQRHILVWNRLLPVLRELAENEGWLLDIDSSYRIEQGVATLSGEASDAGHGWFDLKLDLNIAGATLDTAKLMTAWMQADTPENLIVQGEDGHWASIDMSPLKPMLGLLLELYSDGDVDKAARLPSFKALELDALEDINVHKAPALKKLRRELKNFKGVKTVAPARNLEAELRDYQQQGLNWLMFLHRYGFGGILADDMGLGKTLQTLAFLQKLKAGRKLTQGALIVAPTSLIWNWQREAERFTPNLRTLVLHGLERKEWFPHIGEYDLVITTYALIQRDFDVHANYAYDVAVLDEAQNIKNCYAKTTRKVKQLPANMRLCLTGTPLENHLGELWSIADYVLPGLLGDQDHFRNQFRQPIERDGDSNRSRDLSHRVAPFMLRRTKAEVVKELPPKTEMCQVVHLEGKQKTLYESIRVSMEKRVRQLIKAKGVAKSRIEFLDALLKLRQACIDPQLVKLKQAKGIKQSAKMNWLMDNIPEMVEEGRKILLFSQFTTMLDLIEAELIGRGIGSVKLTGRTRKREAVISAFQEGDTPIFLISLKAGGSGLNLTAADTVVHVDPWWNPAVENQATDRAYRIGQDKTVFVYKLVAGGTVEEKIQTMQQSKQALADNLFDETRKVGLPASDGELLELFQAG